MRFLKNYLWVAIGALISMLLVNAANLMTPLVLKALIDEGIEALNFDAVLWAAGGLLAIAVTRGLFNFLQGYWSEVASQGVAFDLRNNIFENLQNLSFSFHDRAQTGKLMTRMTSDVEIVRMYVGSGFLQMLSGLIMLGGTIIAMLAINWKLALIVLGVIPVIFGVLMKMMRSVFPISREVQRKLGELNSLLQENLAGMRVVKAFAREEYELERYSQQNQALLGENLNFLRLFTSHFPLIFFTANLGTIGVVWFGGSQVIGGEMSLGVLVAFLGYLNLMLMPMFMIGMIAAMLSRAEASAQRIFEVLDAESDVKDKEGATALEGVKGAVKFEDVIFRYAGSEQNVLDGISF
ncbi:MAG: ABC transporter ATP-binding protein, partial [Anaerolineae bacterium]|nr:ABC transporter ATP-binding protein [Anaerolineae bacterium]